MIAEKYDGANVTVYGIGKKGADAFANKNMLNRDVLPENPFHIFDDLIFENSSKISSTIMESFVDKTFDQVVLVYNSFKNAAVQIVKEEQYLPVEQNKETSGSSINYIFEPDESEILEDLIPRSLAVQLYKSLLDSNAAENGARMTAMHKATDNADDLLKELKLTYNKLRQAAITNEILEIVGGAEALSS